MTIPTISIIMANYNYGNYIRQAIDSILAQSYKDWELIIVDNGSSDNSLDIIKEYTNTHQNIFLYQHPNAENKGLLNSIKLGLSKSNGEYITFLESDDYWEKTTLEKRLDIFQKHPDVVLVFNNIQEFGDADRINVLKNHYKDCENICEDICWPADISHYIGDLKIIITFSAIMTKKVCFEKCDFNLPIDPQIDTWFLPQITMMGNSYYIKEKLTNYRVNPKSYGNGSQTIHSRGQSKALITKLLYILKKQNLTKFNDLIPKIIIQKLLVNPINTFKSERENLYKTFKNKKVYVYGAGIFANEAMESFNFSDLNVAGFIDISVTKAGKEINGYKIFHRDQIPELNPDIIILCVSNPDLLYYNLMGWLLKNDIKTMVIPNLFNELKYKNILNKIKQTDMNTEELLSEIVI